jgi:uncharacterized protein
LDFTGLYLDSNALIYALEGDDDELREAFKRLFNTVIFFQMHTSELALAELLVDPHRRGDDTLIERYKRLFQTSGNGFIRVDPVSTAILTSAASLRGRQIRFLGRKPSLLDSIHAASALYAGCSHFMTSDQGLRLWDQIKKIPATAVGISAFLNELA